MPVSDWTLTRGTYVIGTQSSTLKVAFVEYPDIWQIGVRSHDTEFEGRDGAFAGIDVRTALLLTWSWRVVSFTKDADAVMDNIASARSAFAPSATDVTITVTAPGSRSIQYTGRPRNFVSQTQRLDLGLAECQASFYVPSGVPTSGSL